MGAPPAVRLSPGLPIWWLKLTKHRCGRLALRIWPRHPVWPGLDEASLFENRDLMPVDDLRRYLAWLLMGLYGVGREQLTPIVFPGLDIGSDPGLLEDRGARHLARRPRHAPLDGVCPPFAILATMRL